MKRYCGLIIFVVWLVSFTGCAPSLYDLVEQDIAAGEIDTAVKKLESNLQANPQDYQAWRYLGRCQLLSADTLEALASLNKSLEVQSNTPALCLLAEVYLELQHLNKADSLLKEAMISDKAEDLLVDKLSNRINGRLEKAAAVFASGIEEYKDNNFRQAAVHFQKACFINRDDEEAEYYMHMAEGLELYHKGITDAYWDAILEFGEASFCKPERGEPHYLMGVCYQKKDPKDFDNPIAQYRKALELELREDYKEKLLLKLKELKERKRKLDEFWGK
ncbi:tetratricopeptide repeat protein [bacterium]|nr:tetratricopeptide repeat protein [bacterium]